MIDREYRGGPVILRCDGCAPEYCETGEQDLAAAMAVARDEGWQVILRDGDWLHHCPDCRSELPRTGLRR